MIGKLKGMVDSFGDDHVLIDCGGENLLARLTAKSVDALGLVPGSVVHAVIKSVSIEGP